MDDRGGRALCLPDARPRRRPKSPKRARAAGPEQRPPVPWTLGNARRRLQGHGRQFGRIGLKPGEYLWAASIPRKATPASSSIGCTQMAYVYRGDKLVGAATISTAKQGHITPLGEWTILEKRPFYRSKKYDNAPMPWMQRIDDMASRCTAAEPRPSREPRLHPSPDEVRRKALRPDEDRHRRSSSKADGLARRPQSLQRAVSAAWAGQGAERGQQPRLIVLEQQLAVVEMGDRFGQREAKPGAFVGPAGIEPAEAPQRFARDGRAGCPGRGRRPRCGSASRRAAPAPRSRRLPSRSGSHSRGGC